MKNVVITRKVDELGRVVIPIDLREELGICVDKDVPVHLSVPNEDGIYTMTVNSFQLNTKIQEKLGFLILPQTERYKNDLNKCSLDMWIEDGKLRLKKTVPQCMISGDTENLVRYKDIDKYLSEHVTTLKYMSLYLQSQLLSR